MSSARNVIARAIVLSSSEVVESVAIAFTALTAANLASRTGSGVIDFFLGCETFET